MDIFRERVFLRSEEHGPRIIPLVQLREEVEALGEVLMTAETRVAWPAEAPRAKRRRPNRTRSATAARRSTARRSGVNGHGPPDARQDGAAGRMPRRRHLAEPAEAGRTRRPEAAVRRRTSGAAFQRRPGADR